MQKHVGLIGFAMVCHNLVCTSASLDAGNHGQWFRGERHGTRYMRPYKPPQNLQLHASTEMPRSSVGLEGWGGQDLSGSRPAAC